LERQKKLVGEREKVIRELRTSNTAKDTLIESLQQELNEANAPLDGSFSFTGSSVDLA
jgi:hypothetical protein